MARTSESILAAIKQAVDIVTLVGEYLPLTRAGSKYKVLCPFHDDHRPSMELNPDRQSFKCWVCDEGGDVFDFIMKYERIEFPEALRMLAERAGVALDAPSAADAVAGGISKTELLAVNAWAEKAFTEALGSSEPARAYVASRGIGAESVERFSLGYAPGERGWLLGRARREGFPVDLLEKAGLVGRPADAPDQVRERFRGRLIFPIHDPKGRAVGFGGRVLPEVEQALAASGKRAAKYLNSPETPLFKKRQVLYAGDLARPAARESGWVAVVEGYTDVIAAHQVGLCNVVGTLGTALGEDHVVALRRLADRVVLIFDGDDAGQSAADRSLEIFLSNELDVRVLTLPEDLDPCDFLLKEGAEPFRALVAKAVDPLAFALSRAASRYDLGSIEGSRQAAEWVLGILARVPQGNDRVGLDVKVAKALDTLSGRLRVSMPTLERRLRQIRREAKPPRTPRAGTVPFEATGAAAGGGAGPRPTVDAARDRAADADAATPGAAKPARRLDLKSFDRDDRELIDILLNRPTLIPRVITRVSVSTLRDEPLRAILGACYDLYSEGQTPSFEVLSLRLEDPQLRAFVAGFFMPQEMSEVNRHPIDPQPLEAGTAPAPWDVRLDQLLLKLNDRDRQERMRDLKTALDETNSAEDPDAHRALLTEYLRLLNQRPDTKKKNAS